MQIVDVGQFIVRSHPVSQSVYFYMHIIQSFMFRPIHVDIQSSREKRHKMCLKGSPLKYMYVQVNLCQKLLFLHQLTHNMTTDCSLFMKIVCSEYLQNMLYTQIVVFVLTFSTILVYNMFCICSELLKKIYLYQARILNSLASNRLSNS